MFIIGGMRKPFAIILLMPFMALASCSGNASSNEERFLVDRSGDLLVSNASTYATIGNQRTYKQMLSSLENGETVLFTFASYNCSHCHDLEAAYVQYLREAKPYMYIYYLSDNSVASTTLYTETIEGIAAYYGIEKANDNPFRWTPTIFIGNKDGYSRIQTEQTSLQYLENSFKNQTDFSNLYYFSSFSNYKETSKEDILTILYSQENDADDLFHDQFYDLAHQAEETTYLIDYDTLPEEEKSEALAYFGLEEYSLSFMKNDENIKKEDALSYYGASSN